MISEILAGMVGRTGTVDNTQNENREFNNSEKLPDGGGADDIVLAPTGYLYAGWPGIGRCGGR